MMIPEGKGFYAENYRNSVSDFCLCSIGIWEKCGYFRKVILFQEIEKLLLLLMGEITYRKEALPEAMLRVSKRYRNLLRLLKETAKMAQKYQGERFSFIFRENAEKYLKNSALTEKDFEEFVQLGEYLGYLDTDMQKNTSQWYLQQLKTEIDTLAGEIPVKKKLYQSLGILSGVFLAILLL